MNEKLGKVLCELFCPGSSGWDIGQCLNCNHKPEQIEQAFLSSGYVKVQPAEGKCTRYFAPGNYCHKGIPCTECSLFKLNEPTEGELAPCPFSDICDPDSRECRLCDYWGWHPPSECPQKPPDWEKMPKSTSQVGQRLLDKG